MVGYNIHYSIDEEFVLVDRRALIPVGEDAGQALERVLEAYSKSGVGLAECLDTDATALSASDMRYFDGEYFGRVPNYATFMRYVNGLPLEQRNGFKEIVAEIEAERSIKAMRGIAEASEGSALDARRFNMYRDLNKAAEKRLDRIDRQNAAKAVVEEKGADLAARIITALSNKDLLRIKGQVDAIDAEYKEVADG